MSTSLRYHTLRSIQWSHESLTRIQCLQDKPQIPSLSCAQPTDPRGPFLCAQTCGSAIGVRGRWALLAVSSTAILLRMVSRTHTYISTLRRLRATRNDTCTLIQHLLQRIRHMAARCRPHLCMLAAVLVLRRWFPQAIPRIASSRAIWMWMVKIVPIVGTFNAVHSQNHLKMHNWLGWFAVTGATNILNQVPLFKRLVVRILHGAPTHEMGLLWHSWLLLPDTWCTVSGVEVMCDALNAVIRVGAEGADLEVGMSSVLNLLPIGKVHDLVGAAPSSILLVPLGLFLYGPNQLAQLGALFVGLVMPVYASCCAWQRGTTISKNQETIRRWAVFWVVQHSSLGLWQMLSFLVGGGLRAPQLALLGAVWMHPGIFGGAERVLQLAANMKLRKVIAFIDTSSLEQACAKQDKLNHSD